LPHNALVTHSVYAYMSVCCIAGQQVLTVSAVSQGLMYATCLLLMMPLGAGLRSLAAQLLALAQRNKVQLPNVKLPFALPKFNDNTYLALKLAGVLAWPCISVAAVLQPSVVAHNSFTSNFPVAALQVGVCTLLLVLLLSVAVAASRFATNLGRRRATTDAVLGFGFQVGGVCCCGPAQHGSDRAGPCKWAAGPSSASGACCFHADPGPSGVERLAVVPHRRCYAFNLAAAADAHPRPAAASSEEQQL
ncbi:hypothetical protein COO60DRAFT_1519060, partial [Scenedesmus sp. NREL 46B-D3]